MSSKHIDRNICGENPLSLFADMPFLIDTMQRVKLALAQTLAQEITPTNYKRAGTLVTYATQLTSAHGKAMIALFAMMEEVMHMEQSIDQQQSADFDERVTRMEGYFAFDQFSNQLMDNIAYWVNEVYTEQMVEKMLALPISNQQQQEILDRYIKQMGILISDCDQEDHATRQLADATRDKLLQEFHQGESDMDLEYIAACSSENVSKEFEVITNMKLEFYAYLLHRKNTLTKEIMQ